MTTYLSNEISKMLLLHCSVRLHFMQSCCVALAIMLCTVSRGIIQGLQPVRKVLRMLADTARSKIQSHSTHYTHLDIILPSLHIRPDNPTVVC